MKKFKKDLSFSRTYSPIGSSAEFTAEYSYSVKEKQNLIHYIINNISVDLLLKEGNDLKFYSPNKAFKDSYLISMRISGDKIIAHNKNIPFRITPETSCCHESNPDDKRDQCTRCMTKCYADVIITTVKIRRLKNQPSKNLLSFLEKFDIDSIKYGAKMAQCIMDDGSLGVENFINKLQSNYTRNVIATLLDIYNKGNGEIKKSIINFLINSLPITEVDERRMKMYRVKFPSQLSTV